MKINITWRERAVNIKNNSIYTGRSLRNSCYENRETLERERYSLSFDQCKSQ